MKKQYEKIEPPALTPEQMIKKNEISTTLYQEILKVKQIKRDSQNFYNSAEWRAARDMTIARDGGIDVLEYLLTGRVVFPDDIEVHHIEELIDAPELRSDLGNLVCLSHNNHRFIDALYNKADKEKIKAAFKWYAEERNKIFFANKKAEEEKKQVSEDEANYEMEQLSIFDMEIGGAA